MPTYPVTAKESIEGFNGAAGDVRGQRSTRFSWSTGKGIPRFADLITIRALEKTHTVSLPIDTVQQQVSTTPFSVIPKPGPNESPTTAHEDAAEGAEMWLRRDFNGREETFDQWMKQIVNGILSVNVGATELVPDQAGYVREIYARDGATLTKNPDKHGRLPDPPDPAYWQFSLHSAIEPFSRDRALRDLANEVGPLGYGRRARQPIPFSKDEIMWISEDGKEWHTYGFGRVQKVKNLVEIILNQDLSNKKYFPANEVPEGIVNIVEANSDQVQEVREWWNDEIKGERHKVGILGGDGSEIEWMPFRATPDELEFIESQEWYNKLVWMTFGLNQNEVGDISEITRPGGTEQFASKVFHRTTKPLLELIANAINGQLLPYREEYEAVNGEIEFVWNYDNPEIQRLERQRQNEDLERGLATVNEVRVDRGEDELPWGDLPDELRKSAFRNFPRWALEQFGDFEELPDPAPSGPGDLLSAPSPLASSTEPDPAEVFGSEEDLAASPDEARDDSLRNDYWRGEFPPLAGHIDDLERDVAVPFEEVADDLEELVAEEFPDEEPEDRAGPDGETKGILPDLDDIVGAISLAPRLERIVTEANTEAMGQSAEWHGENLEEELAERLDEEELEVELGFDVEDTTAQEILERRSAQKMRGVEDHVKDRVRDTLGTVAAGESDEYDANVNGATEALRDKIGELSDSHSRLVARTETLEASRHGSQALAETNDAIEGKEWVATDDNRTRDWHSAMDGVIVGKDEEWTVPKTGDDDQPSDYPRNTYTVGGDQPFNCRCGQRPVISEEMPEKAADVNAKYADVAVYPATDPKKADVAESFARRGETIVDVIERAITETGSKTAAAKELGISKPTLYDWMDALASS